jgi:hypothetical protein
MPTLYDLFGDTSGLPVTTRSGTPYEIEALSPREVWGAGNSSTSVVCRQKWSESAAWIRDMVGTVSIATFAGQAVLSRGVPEALGYADGRVQFCSMVDQVEQGGNPNDDDGTAEDPDNFTTPEGWPQTLWCKYRATFEAFPYAVLSDDDVSAAQDAFTAAGGAIAGAPELFRYIIRTRKTYSREQPIPAAGPAGGFRVVDDSGSGPGKVIGQAGFRVVSMADVTYKWVRVPVGWPPPIGYTGGVSPWPGQFNPAGINVATDKRPRDKYIGSVNSTDFDTAAPDGYCFPAGTLFYVGYDDSERYFDAAGQWVCDVVYSFKFKEGGWNTFLNALGQFEPVTDNGRSATYGGGTPGNPPYTGNDFNNLFQSS